MTLYIDQLRDVLEPELTTDPLGRGYSGMSDAAAAADLNTSYRATERSFVDGAEIFNVIVPAEYTALAADSKTMVQWITQLGSIDVRTGTNARTALLSIFVAGTTTRSNLAALVSTTRTRAAELGLPQVNAADVATARSM